MPVFSAQPQSTTAFWPVLISHPAYRVEGWVGLGGYLHAKMVYPLRTNWARRI